MDRMMRRFGLNGKSVVPLIGGMACAVPSIMSTRSIENSRDRLITILVTPLMSCSARLPVYTLLIGLVTPEKYIFGFIGIQGLLLFLMYLVGFFSAIFVAWIFKFIIKQGTGNFFVMELPVYKLPALRNLWLNVYDRSKTFVREAGLIIVGVSVVLWFAGSFGPGNSFAQIEKNYADKMLTQQIPKADLDIQMKTEKLEASYAGHFGHLIEPLIKPLGFDWKIGIALISSFAAREVFVGTMSTIYSIGDEENTKGIRERMRAEKDPATGLPKYTPVLALSLMFFYAFALQCTSTIAVVRRETKGWKWPIIQLVFMTLMAWTSSFVIYQVFH
jgi:ferrous iron transport protein B